MNKAINIFVSLSFALGIMLLSAMITKAVYRPTEAEVGRVLEGTELLIHKQLMKKHGIRNTSVVYVHHDGGGWYFNQKRQYCRFK